MGDNKVVINSNTIIQITLSKLIGLISSVLAVFFGFYIYVIEPQIQLQQEQLKILTQQIDKLKMEQIKTSNSIGILAGTIEGTSGRFRDLHEARSSNEETSGSFKN